MGAIDYDKLATISWLNPSHLGETSGAPVEEYCDVLTLKEAVTFAMDYLDARCRKSVIISCGSYKYNLFDIEEMHRKLDHFQRSAPGHSRPFRAVRPMSGLPPKAAK